MFWFWFVLKYDISKIDLPGGRRQEFEKGGGGEYSNLNNMIEVRCLKMCGVCVHTPPAMRII